jgi:GNAT superfamily N-acetyltransferase
MRDGPRIRNAVPDDHAQVIRVLDGWWGGRRMRDMLPRLFFVHFAETTFVAEGDGRLVAFLAGFLSQTDPRTAYIHFVGVAPEERRTGVARALYVRFFEVARAGGRSVVRCVTSPVNEGSIAFHRRMGFRLVPGDVDRDGVPIHRDYDGPGEDRVVFERGL